MPSTATHFPTIINHASSQLTRCICSSLTTSLWVKTLVQGLAEGWREVALELPSSASSHGAGAQTLSLSLHSPANPGRGREHSETGRCCEWLS